MTTFTDIFCGAGGSSIGLTAAGFELRLAANHWDRAIQTHAANFPGADHLCADVSNYDMRRLPRTDVLWASPICTEISPAGGRRRNRTRGQVDLLEQDGHVGREAFDRTRATAFDVIRATEVHRYRYVLCENVVEFATDWELFDWWVDGMRRLGYTVQTVCVSSAHIGGATNPHAPQWRDRLYLVFTRAGMPVPDVAPRPLALCVECGEDVAAVQSWKNPRGPKLGKYRQQYVYRCPSVKCRHAVVEPYILPAAAAIDWSDIGGRIGDRARPLAEATRRRIRAGLALFADCPPMLIPSGGTWAEAPMSAPREPMRTRTANPKGFEALATPQPFVTILRNHQVASGVDVPLSTVTTGGERGGSHQYLTVPPGAFYMKNYGGYADPKRMSKSVGEPFGTVTASSAGGHHALVVPYYRTGRATRAADPFGTVTTHDRHALVTGRSVDVDDCHFRMIQPRESLRAQRFPDSYVVTGNRGEQTMQAGNAVSANVAQWIGECVAAALN